MAHRETAKHREAFEAWYAADRQVRNILQNLAVPERTLYQWIEWFGWHERADKRDRDAAEIAERNAVKRKGAMLLRHQKAGELLVTRGIEFFEQKAIEKASEATAAIKVGVELERQAEGMPDWVVSVMNADERDLDRQIAEYERRREATLPAAPETAGDARAVASATSSNGHRPAGTG